MVGIAYHAVMSRQELYEVAGLQHGYFRTRQALDVGWSRAALNTAVNAGEIRSITYGLYRFAHYPATVGDELHEIQTLAPDGTFSHETALTLFGLSDLLPRTTHLIIRPGSGFKPRPGLTIHHMRLAPDERVLRDGLWLTAPLRTFIDAARAGAEPDQLLAAARQARSAAILSPASVARLAMQYPYTLLGPA